MQGSGQFEMGGALGGANIITPCKLIQLVKDQNIARVILPISCRHVVYCK